MFGEDSRPEDEASYDLTHPLDGNRAYDSAAVGWNYRTTELSAAIARAQLVRLPHWNEAARANAELLTRRLRDLPGVTPPEVSDRPGARLPQVPGAARRLEAGGRCPAGRGARRDGPGAARRGLRGRSLADPAGPGTDAVPAAGRRVPRTARPRELRPRPISPDAGDSSTARSASSRRPTPSHRSRWRSSRPTPRRSPGCGAACPSCSRGRGRDERGGPVAPLAAAGPAGERGRRHGSARARGLGGRGQGGAHRPGLQPARAPAAGPARGGDAGLQHRRPPDALRRQRFGGPDARVGPRRRCGLRGGSGASDGPELGRGRPRGDSRPDRRRGAGRGGRGADAGSDAARHRGVRATHSRGDAVVPPSGADGRFHRAERGHHRQRRRGPPCLSAAREPGPTAGWTVQAARVVRGRVRRRGRRVAGRAPALPGVGDAEAGSRRSCSARWRSPPSASPRACSGWWPPVER